MNTKLILVNNMNFYYKIYVSKCLKKKNLSEIAEFQGGLLAGVEG